jgi:sulfur-oxidizing protein SoxY
MARWSDLRHAIFGDRTVEDAGDLVAIDAPARAEDAATVPVAIRVAETLAPEIRGLYLVIDNNPSPLAAHFLLGPIADAREIATRVRIDDYTYLHAVAETADGRLYATAHFIKAAGGCSAPASKDQALALERLGKMKLILADRSRPGEPINAKLLISHPNSSGLQMDPVTRNYIPADFMQTLDVIYNGETVFRLESDIAISEDPGFNFSLRAPDPAGPGVIKAEVLDSNQRHFSQSWPVPAAAQM